jgi:hypothetical protein
MAVARQQHPVLERSQLDEHMVARMRRVERVESEHAQPAGEALEHRIGEEAVRFHASTHVTDHAARH